MRQLLILRMKVANPFYDMLVRGTIENKEEIDSALTENLENWSLRPFAKN